MLPDVHARPARRHRHDRRRRGRSASRRPPPRRRRPVLRRRGRQGHGDVLRHRERDLAGVRLLARRRVRLGRLGRLRPQGDGDHRARRVGVGQAALPRARPRHRRGRLHGRRDRRHVRRRVRERDAALAAAQVARRVRPPPRLPRSGPQPRGEPRGAEAALRAARFVLGRLRPEADLQGRRRLPAQREVDRALARGARGARRRGSVADAERTSSGRCCARPSICSGTAASART